MTRMSIWRECDSAPWSKQLRHWHRERSYSIAEKSRLDRYRHLSDGETLNTQLSLADKCHAPRTRSQVLDFIGGKGGTRTLDPGIMRKEPGKKNP